MALLGMRCTQSPAQPREQQGCHFRHVDDRDGYPFSLEMMPQLDARSIVQVYIEDDANRLFEIGVAFESLCRRKQDRFVCVLPEQPLDSLQHSRVVIDNQNNVPIFQSTISLIARAIRLE